MLICIHGQGVLVAPLLLTYNGRHQVLTIKVLNAKITSSYKLWVHGRFSI